MEDNIKTNGRRPKKKWEKMEDDLKKNGKKMEDDLKKNKNGRRPQAQFNKINLNWL